MVPFGISDKECAQYKNATFLMRTEKCIAVQVFSTAASGCKERQLDFMVSYKK